MDEQLAKEAHDVFHEHAKGPNHPANLPAPDFEKQPEHVKKAWQKVAEHFHAGLKHVEDAGEAVLRTGANIAMSGKLGQ